MFISNKLGYKLQLESGIKYSAVKMHLAEIAAPQRHISAVYCEIQPNVAAVNVIMTVFMV